jgi:hypothetical protein
MKIRRSSGELLSFLLVFYYSGVETSVADNVLVNEMDRMNSLLYSDEQ